MRVCRHRRSLNAECYREAPMALTPQPEADQAAHQPLGLDSGPRFALTLAERTLTLLSASLPDAHVRRPRDGASPHVPEGRRGSTAGKTPGVPMLPHRVLVSLGDVLSRTSGRGELLRAPSEYTSALISHQISLQNGTRSVCVTAACAVCRCGGPKGAKCRCKFRVKFRASGLRDCCSHAPSPPFGLFSAC